MPVSPATRNALIGVAVGVGCAAFVVFRLVQASAPQPTTLRFWNDSATPVTVARLSLGPEVVLAAETTFPASSPAAPAPHFESRAVLLAPGRPVSAKVQLAGSSDARVCELEPRPHGDCIVTVALTGASAPRCEFTCRQPEPR